MALDSLTSFISRKATQYWGKQRSGAYEAALAVYGWQKDRLNGALSTTMSLMPQQEIFGSWNAGQDLNMLHTAWR